MESNHRNGQSRPKPPPRSSSIRANLCKFLTSKTSKTSYVLNHHHSHVHNDDCHSKHSFNETTAKTLPKSHVSCSSLSTSSSSPHDGRSSSHPLARLREEPTAKSAGFASKHINFFRSKKQSSSVDMEFNEIPGVSSKKKLWIKSFTSLNGPLLAAGGRDTASGDTQENVVSREGPSSIPSNVSSKQEPSAITSQIVNINTSGVKMRVKKAMEQQGKKSRPKSEATFFEELYSKKKMESNVQKGNNKKQNRYSTIEGNLRFGSLETYARLDPLGEGSYATVYKGYSYLMSKVVALKEIRLEMEEGTPFTAIREASILRCLRHANIVTLHDIIHTKETLTFVFEFVQTDLSRYLELHPGGLHPDNVRIFLFQLLRGLEFCHKRQILHRDLKPQNLLISEIGDLKLADFGLARAKSVPSSTYSHEVVTLWYRPPDVLLGSTDYTTSLDIWGVGCIFVEMISGAAAFPGVKDANDQLDKIWKVLGTPSTKDWDQLIFLPHFKPHSHRSYPAKKLSEAFPDLTKIALGEEFADKCLQLNPKKRISASDALQDSFFSPLPDQVHKLTPAETIFSVPGIKLKPELTTISSSALKAAKKLREKQKRSSRD